MEKKNLLIAFLAIGISGCVRIPLAAPQQPNPRIVERNLAPDASGEAQPPATRKVARSLLTAREVVPVTSSEDEQPQVAIAPHNIPGRSRVEETPAELQLPSKSAAPGKTATTATEATAATAATAATTVAVSAHAPAAAPKPVVASDRVKRSWVLNTSFQTLEEALIDFASQVDYEVVYEAREFPLGLKRNITLASDADFWEALQLLGEAYRQSDGAFQIQPTQYKQIVVLPMGQSVNQKGSQ